MEVYPLVMTNIAIENGGFIDISSGFTHWTWWIFPQFFVCLPEGISYKFMGIMVMEISNEPYKYNQIFFLFFLIIDIWGLCLKIGDWPLTHPNFSVKIEYGAWWLCRGLGLIFPNKFRQSQVF